MAHVLEGSVQRAANKIRVNAQLIDARTDAHLWAQTYDRDLADVFAIQSEIAKAIADQLQAKLSPNEKKRIEKPPTTDLAAFDLYSRAKSLLLAAALISVDARPIGARQSSYLMKRLSAIRHFSTLTASLPLRTNRSTQCRALIILQPGLPWLKLLSKPRHGCGQMLAKRIWRARISLLRAARLCRRIGRIGERAPSFTE